jgi:ubiquitin-conjugating enzyme E2 D
MTSIKRVQKEIADNQKSKNHCYMVNPHDDDVFCWSGYIYGSEGSPYQGGAFEIEFLLPPNYPYAPPKVFFKTKIFHPNINSKGSICLDILRQDKWSPALNIESMMLSVCSLLTDPNPDDPLAPNVASLYKENYPAYVETAKLWTQQYATI